MTTDDRTKAQPNEEVVDQHIPLQDRVIAIVDSDDGGGAATALSSRGWQVTTLKSEADVELLEPKTGGLSGALAKAAAFFGDEIRIIDQIERTLSEGNQVLVVTGHEDAAPVVKVLRDHGALSIWDFGTWTFVNTGTSDEVEEETG